MTNLEKYDRAFMETFGVNNEKLPNMYYNDCIEWDSVAHMQLIAVIENTFDIMLEMEDVVDFNSYNKGKDILSKYDIKI